MLIKSKIMFYYLCKKFHLKIYYLYVKLTKYGKFKINRN